MKSDHHYIISNKIRIDKLVNYKIRLPW